MHSIVGLVSRSVALLAWLPVAQADAQDFIATRYFPMEPGRVWEDVVTAGPLTGSNARFEVLPFPGDVNGTPTMILLGSGLDAVSGEQHFTNDGNGIRLHLVDVPSQGISLELAPPVVVGPASGSAGQRLLGSGTMIIDGPGIPPFTLPYEATSVIVGRRRVTVPAGTFDTFRLDLTISASGSFQGVPISLTETDSLWLAPNVGPVRQTQSATFDVAGERENESFAFELVESFNPLREDFEVLGGHQAYLAAPSNVDLLANGAVCDQESAFAHWLDYGRFEGRAFAAGDSRSDPLVGEPDPDFLIDGGFSWRYPDENTVVIITMDAPKPSGWDGRDLLLERCQQFALGTAYTAQGYRDHNPDVAMAIDGGLIPNFASVTDHYVKYGFKEGRLTNSNFTPEEQPAWDDEAYLSANPDVRTFFEGAASEGWRLFGDVGFAHWINFGRFEGRNDGQP